MVRLRRSASSASRQRRDVAAADPQHARRRPVEAAEQVHQRRLARARTGPTTATYSPGSMRRLTPRSASTDDPVELVAARVRRRPRRPGVAGHDTCWPSRTWSAPRTTTRSPDLEPLEDLHPALALRAEPDQALAGHAVHDDPDGVAPAVAEHRRGRARPRRPGRCGPAGRRPRSCPGRGVGAVDPSARVPRPSDEAHDVGHAAAAGAGRRRVDGGRRPPRTSRPGRRPARPTPARRAGRAARRSRRPAR